MLKAVICLLLVSTALAFEDKTVYQYLVDNGYTMLVNFLKSTNQESVLQGPGPMTVFAPIDSAFAKADPKLISSLTDVQAKTIARYHIADGFHLVPQLMSGGAIPTKEGQNIAVTHSGSTVRLNNDSRITSNNDIICNNGVVQPIDTILMPPVFGQFNIAQVLITRDDTYRNFFMYLLQANLTVLLESGEYTVFAPTDMAWGKYFEDALSTPNVSQNVLNHQLVEMMKYHIVPGARTTDMFQTGQDLYTLHGYPLNVTKTASDIYVYNAKITEGNIAASNGVIHGINDAMYPLDLYQEYLNALKQQQSSRR